MKLVQCDEKSKIQAMDLLSALAQKIHSNTYIFFVNDDEMSTE